MAVVVATAVMSVGALGGTGFSEAATATGPTRDLSVTVTPTEGLTDGDPMTITVTRTAAGTSAGVEIIQVGTGWCAPGTSPWSGMGGIGVTAQGSTLHTLLPSLVNGRHCATSAYPLNGDPLLDDVLSPSKKATGNYTSFTGTVPAQASGGAQLPWGVLACDVTSPCTFAVAVEVVRNTSTTVETFVFLAPVTYAPTAETTACGGAALGQLTSIGPDRLGQLLSTWTVDGCRAKVGDGKALTRVVSTGDSDGKALCDFASGTDDLAYSAVGYSSTPTSPFNPANCPAITGGPSPARPYIAVPIALDAVVLAHTQTVKVTTATSEPSFRDYTFLEVTDAQLAGMLGAAGATNWETPFGQALVAENPTLGEDFFRQADHEIIAGGSGNTTGKGVAVTSGPQATTLFATEFAHALAPTTLVSPSKGHPLLQPVTNFSLATPPFDTNSDTGFPALLKTLTGSGFTGNPWALFSTADAAKVWFGMADASLQVPGSSGSAPVYVAATTKVGGSMQAAVTDMILQADGTLVPNPEGGPVNGKEPYPLTYVEYALAPAQPLMTASCMPRTQSEQNLVDWLGYITGAGQSELPKGLAPLPPSLQAQAQADIVEVGQATPDCTPVGAGTPASATTTPTTGTTATGKGTSTTGGTSTSTGTTPTSITTQPAGATTHMGGSGAADVASSSERAASTAAVPLVSSPTSSAPIHSGGKTPPPNRSPSGHVNPAVDLVGFRVTQGTGWGSTFLGVLVLMVLVPGLALLTSGRMRRWALRGMGRHGGVSGGGERPEGRLP